MKKIIKSTLLLVLVLISSITFAEKVGTVNAIWTNPAAFKPDKTVTFYFDLTGTGLVGMNDLHLYSWTPKEIEPWGTPTVKTLLTKDPNNDALYSLTCIPTDLWATAVGDFGLKIEGLIKTADGTKQTEDFSEANGNHFQLFDYGSLNTNIAQVWPPNFTWERPISVIVNLATAWSDGGSVQGQLLGEPNVFIWLGINSWNPSSNYNALGNINAKCESVSGMPNLAEYDFLPENTFPAPPVAIKELDFLFNNGTWDKTARDVAGADFKFKPLIAGAGSASFKAFPGKVTQGDLLNIIYNPSIDTMASGLNQGILTGSEKIFVYMEIETTGGNVIPIEKSLVTQTDKLLMTTNPDGTYTFSFILRELFTAVEWPDGLEAKKITYTFLNYDGLESPFNADMPKNVVSISIAD
ncbi:MAG: hypothetical protein AB9842_09635 [Bacteroidales bacterium]